MNYGTSNIGSDILFSIHCGDWIYPSEDSTSPIRYPIDYPLVLMMFAPDDNSREVYRAKKYVDDHLNASRRLHCKYLTDENTLILQKLTNDAEPEYECELGDNYIFSVDKEYLPRSDEFGIYFENAMGNTQSAWSIFVTSVLLMDYYNKRKPDSWGTSKLYFRRATIREIESLGRW